MDKRTALKVARAYIKFLTTQRYKIKKAFLFGSYVSNRFTDNSDIDIALVMKGYNDNFTEFLKLMRLRRNFDLRIEPHPINEKEFKTENPFVREIKRGLKL